MSTRTHDEMIEDAVQWAQDLGYEVVEFHTGTETGADAIFKNHRGERVILEVVTGARFDVLFQKERIIKALQESPFDMLGLIVVADRTELVKEHGRKAGLLPELFNSTAKKRVFPVLARNFDKIIPVLLVSLLGARASAVAIIK